ncbi:MAG TPA: ATP-binding cassette domain-containing protein, partial [Clostridia bacterium]|nr:ATP-binding cassette domain-containing protein [Clostridia bacterium]
MSQEVFIQIDGVSVNYGNNTALRDVTMKIYKGDYLCVVGPNGGGKTTLLKAILGLVKVYGTIKIYNGAHF